MRRFAVSLSAVAVALSGLVRAAPAPESILPNGGFEAITPANGVPAAGGEFRQWTLRNGNGVPAGWTLNAWFKGELEVDADPAPEVGRYLRIRAPREREAHIELPTLTSEAPAAFQALDFAVRYRGGSVLLASYEYTVPGKAPDVVTVAVSGDPAADGRAPEVWRRFACRYVMPGVPFRLALGVAAGAVAEVDGAELRPVSLDLGPGGQWLNVRDFGATGSGFETAATVAAGEAAVTVAEVGDFRPGQAVTLSRCHPHYTDRTVRGPTDMYGKCDLGFDDVLEVRGFDGSGGDWLVFLVEVTAVDPGRFRWSDDLARSWKGQDVPIRPEWQPLSGGLEIRFKPGAPVAPGHVLSVSARTQLLTVIERIEGKTVWLRDPPTRSTDQAVMRHSDTAALQTAVDTAIKRQCNLFFPDGHYRLHRGLAVRSANLTIEGRSGEKTLLDISDGTGAVFSVYGGRNVTVRNFRMLGHTGLAEKPGTMRNVNGAPFWCCALKPCSAMTFHGVENMLVENVHAARMASEAFYCQGPSRVSGQPEPELYTRALTFRRCSVTDCAANGFNNNDTSENTTVEYCRIDGAGWHAYEGPGRFIRLVGNYVRNAGPFTIGDMSHRGKDLNDLGCGQAMISQNVFESGGICGGIAVNYGARQVTISDNLFVNYNGTAITVSGVTARLGFPSKNMVIRGNLIDLTYAGPGAQPRTGIRVDASHVIVADNQVYVRGDRDPRTTGIALVEGIEDVILHDNLIRNCGAGIRASRRSSSVAVVADASRFTDTALPLEWHVSHRYRGWFVAWVADRTLSILADFDPDTFHFTLAEPRPTMKSGDAFHVFPPQAHWTIHDNTITECMAPVTLDVYGSATTMLRGNLITRGGAADARCAVRLAGQVNLVGNHFQGFDLPGSTTLELLPDPLGRVLPNLIRDNVFQDCVIPVVERAQGLWSACVTAGNLHAAGPGRALEPLTVVSTRVAPPAGALRRVIAGPVPPGLALDGDTGEWPWGETDRVGELRLTPEGDDAGISDRFCAAADGEAILLAFEIRRHAAGQILASPEPYAGDGLEISFRPVGSGGVRGPIFMLWAPAEGSLVGTTYGGATPEQAAVLGRQSAYTARPTQDGWSAELRIPFAAMGLSRADVSLLKFNAGALHKGEGMWLFWTTTGGKLYEVDGAGEIVLR